MSRKNRVVTVKVDPFAVARRSLHRDYVADLRDGRRQRAATMPDKRKVADKNKCRNRVEW